MSNLYNPKKPLVIDLDPSSPEGSPGKKVAYPPSPQSKILMDWKREKNNARKLARAKLTPLSSNSPPRSAAICASSKATSPKTKKKTRVLPPSFFVETTSIPARSFSSKSARPKSGWSPTKASSEAEKRDNLLSLRHPPFTPPLPVRVLYTTSLPFITSTVSTLRESSETVLGFDMEWNVGFYGKQGKTALIQIGDLKTVLLVPIFRMSKFPDTLKYLLEDKSVLKVGVNIGGDARKLYRDFGVALKGVIELSDVARSVDLERWQHKRGLIALQTLTGYYTDLYLPKGSVRTSNWERQLDEEQQNYSRDDVLAAVLVWRRLRALEAIKAEDSVEKVKDVSEWIDDDWATPKSKRPKANEEDEEEEEE
ncbi:ribonuclease H-like protein [Atractiella rhizophila]|nr:ribonuclease H-like protein [Atractiella rhizophila]